MPLQPTISHSNVNRAQAPPSGFRICHQPFQTTSLLCTPYPPANKGSPLELHSSAATRPPRRSVLASLSIASHALRTTPIHPSTHPSTHASRTNSGTSSPLSTISAVSRSPTPAWSCSSAKSGTTRRWSLGERPFPATFRTCGARVTTRGRQGSPQSRSCCCSWRSTRCAARAVWLRCRPRGPDPRGSPCLYHLLVLTTPGRVWWPAP